MKAIVNGVMITMEKLETLVNQIYEKLKFEIDYDDIVEYNFRTISSLLKMIDNYKGIDKSMEDHVKEFKDRTRERIRERRAGKE